MASSIKEFVAAQAGKSSSSKKQAWIVASEFVSYSKKQNPQNWSKNDVFGYLSGIEPKYSRNTFYNFAVQLRSFLRFHGREDLSKLVKSP